MMSQKNNSENYADVVIVGAGPAGSTAALKLSEEGFSTLVLESKMEIGAPVICADLVNMRLQELEGLWEDKRIRLIKPENIELRAGDKSFLIHPDMGEGDAFNTVVERDRLDKELISRAVLGGARLRIRSEFIDVTQIDGNLTVKYKEGGRIASVVAKHIVLANGASSLGVKGGNTDGKRFIYQYGRLITNETSLTPVVDLIAGSNLNYMVPRGHNQYNRVSISALPGSFGTAHNQKGHGREIISGNKDVTLSEEPIPGEGRIINAGIAAGLYDGFFLTGFRESVISGRLAAQAIIESRKSGGDALGLYSGKVGEILLKRMKTQLQFRETLAKASFDQLASLFSELSQYDYNEVSVEEILFRSGFTIREIQERIGIGP